MTKRQRCDDNPGWWSLLRDDVVSNGGFVHPHLGFLKASRTLIAEQNISEGEVVLRICGKNFMTKDRALSMCHPWLENIITADGTSATWKNSTTDLVIAVAMASCRSPESYLYLHSLPESSSFDALPRRWSDEDIRNLLAGTSLLRHVISAKSGVVEDYKLLLQRYRSHQLNGDTNENPSSSFPSFEKFSDMLAAVTSRAFQIGTTEEEIGIVPMLDLGNHTRGNCTSKLGYKNVTYQYDVVKDAMIVKTKVDIDGGESIRLTYGAKSNSQLLLNYGFCIPGNLEPDGSSNDILEFRAHLTNFSSNDSDDSNERCRGKSISLRAGPKSYSYGGFVAALEEYFSVQKSTSMLGNENDKNDIDLSMEETGQSGTADDFEDFMNECKNEDDDSDTFEDLYEGRNSESAAEDQFNTEKIYRDEMEALKKFKLDLIELSKGYNYFQNTDISTSTSVKPGFESLQLYSTILSMSELRTIYFFVRFIEKVEDLLCSKAQNEKKQERSVLNIIKDEEDLVMIDKQTDELAKTYMSIRHGFW